MVTDQQIQDFKLRLDRVERQLNGQLLGNDPSTNVKQYIQAGGSTGGWFALTNNGVVVTINGQPSSSTGQPQGLQVIDQTTVDASNPLAGTMASVDPYNFTLENLVGNTVIGLSNVSGGGVLTINSAAGHQAQIVLVGVGTHFGTMTLTPDQLSFIAHLASGTVTITHTSVVVDDGIGDVTTISGTGSTLNNPIVFGNLQVNNDISLNGYASLAAELLSLQTQINNLNSRISAGHIHPAGSFTAGATAVTGISGPTSL